MTHSCFISDSPAGDVGCEFRVTNTTVVFHVLITCITIILHNNLMHRRLKDTPQIIYFIEVFKEDCLTKLSLGKRM